MIDYPDYPIDPRDNLDALIAESIDAPSYEVKRMIAEYEIGESLDDRQPPMSNDGEPGHEADPSGWSVDDLEPWDGDWPD